MGRAAFLHKPRCRATRAPCAVTVKCALIRIQTGRALLPGVFGPAAPGMSAKYRAAQQCAAKINGNIKEIGVDQFPLAAILEIMFLLVLGLIIMSMFGVTQQNTTKIIAKFGRYVRVTQPGFYTKSPWPFETVAGTISTQVQIAALAIKIKTRDNAFPDLPVKIHYIIEEAIRASRLFDVRLQMDTLVQNVVRSHFADQELADIYKARNEMADIVKQELQAKMADYGLRIVDVIVDNPVIPDDLQRALQSVIISLNTLAATRNNAEAERTTILAKATATADSRKSLGEGIANEQKAIAAGFEESVSNMTKAGLSVDQAIHFIMRTNEQQRDLNIAQAYAGAIKSAVIFTSAPAAGNNATGSVPSTGAPGMSQAEMERIIATITALRPVLEGSTNANVIKA
jgi:regulator of protease activity HflC (stomatin/prohibitin superfamily)